MMPPPARRPLREPSGIARPVPAEAAKSKAAEAAKATEEKAAKTAKAAEEKAESAARAAEEKASETVETARGKAQEAVGATGSGDSEDKDEEAPKVASGTVLDGEEELAQRKGEWRYEGGDGSGSGASVADGDDARGGGSRGPAACGPGGCARRPAR